MGKRKKKSEGTSANPFGYGDEDSSNEVPEVEEPDVSFLILIMQSLLQYKIFFCIPFIFTVC
jgi:hypothetical protein